MILDKQFIKDEVALAMTRPAMVLQVPVMFALCDVMLSALVTLWSSKMGEGLSSLSGMLCGGLLYSVILLFGRLLCQKDERFITLYWRWLHLTPPLPNRQVWQGCNSYHP